MSYPVIRVWNAVSRLEADRETMRFVDEQISPEVPGAQYAKQHRPGWDGKWHPMDRVSGVFPTGLVGAVRKIVPLSHILDEREKPHTSPFRPDILDGVELFEHQCEAVKEALDKANGVLALSVGAGKTECGIAIACHTPGLCVWVTHKRDIFHQTYERILERTGEKAVMVGDGAWDDNMLHKKFMVVMPQTAMKNKIAFQDQVKDAQVLIVDEAHTASAADRWFKIVQMIPAYFRIGLTGTPEVGDPVRELRLQASTGPILIRKRAGDMAKIGQVVPAIVYYHKVVNAPLYRVDWMTARRMLIEENSERNAMIIELAIKAAKEGKRCLVICDTIRHAKVIAEVIRGESVRSRLLTGKHASGARSDAKKDMKSGALEIMISTPIWDMGVDIPALDVLIIAAGGKSASRFIQRCGRAIRSRPGKAFGEIHDFFDTGCHYVVRHSVSRMEACKREGFEVKGDKIPLAPVLSKPARRAP